MSDNISRIQLFFPDIKDSPILSSISLHGITEAREAFSELYHYKLNIHIPLPQTPNKSDQKLIDEINTSCANLIGHPATLVFSDKTTEKSTLSGIVASIDFNLLLVTEKTRSSSVKITQKNLVYHLTICPHLERSKYVIRKIREFNNISIKNIIEKILTDYGYRQTPLWIGMSARNEILLKSKIDVIQFNESDYDFFRRLLCDYELQFYLYQEKLSSGEEPATATGKENICFLKKGFKPKQMSKIKDNQLKVKSFGININEVHSIDPIPPASSNESEIIQIYNCTKKPEILLGAYLSSNQEKYVREASFKNYSNIGNDELAIQLTLEKNPTNPPTINNEQPQFYLAKIIEDDDKNRNINDMEQYSKTPICKVTRVLYSNTSWVTEGVSHWVELASDFADKSSGIFVRPRVDNIVLCMKLSNSDKLPIIVKCLFQNDNIIPVSTNATTLTIRNRRKEPLFTYISKPNLTPAQEVAEKKKQEEEHTENLKKEVIDIATEDICKPLSVEDLNKTIKNFSQIQFVSMDSNLDYPKTSQEKQTQDAWNYSLIADMCLSWIEGKTAGKMISGVRACHEFNKSNLQKKQKLEGINIYSQRDILTQSANSQINNAGGKIILTAGQEIILKVGRSKITINDKGISFEANLLPNINSGCSPDYYDKENAEYQKVDPTNLMSGFLGSSLTLSPSSFKVKAWDSDISAYSTQSNSLALGSSQKMDMYKMKMRAATINMQSGAMLTESVDFLAKTISQGIISGVTAIPGAKDVIDKANTVIGAIVVAKNFAASFVKFVLSAKDLFTVKGCDYKMNDGGITLNSPKFKNFYTEQESVASIMASYYVFMLSNPARTRDSFKQMTNDTKTNVKTALSRIDTIVDPFESISKLGSSALSWALMQIMFRTSLNKDAHTFYNAEKYCLNNNVTLATDKEFVMNHSEDYLKYSECVAKSNSLTAEINECSAKLRNTGINSERQALNAKIAALTAKRTTVSSERTAVTTRVNTAIHQANATLNQLN
ncbi:MAG: contractile injection system protein, VgrG/Pvc8 family [Akkermansia sp.]